MAERNLNVRIILRNDTAANWASSNPILLKGEMAVETDTGKFKFGDGVKQYNELAYGEVEKAVVKTTAPASTDAGYDLGTVWIDTTTKKGYMIYDNTADNAVWKQIVNPDDLSDLGAGDMLKSQFATNPKAEQGYVDKAVLADSATALATGRTISVTGDATGTSAEFNGSGNVSIPVTLADSGVTGGTYTKVTVDAKGRVTQGENLAASDIPNLTLSKITDAGTAAAKNTGSAEGDIPVLGANGKLDSATLPAIAITETFVVKSEEAMLELTAQTGDVAVRTDVNKTYILQEEPASTAENWIEMLTPTDAVLSVNGKTGAVTLTTDDVAEGSTNQYFTEARATSNFETNIATTTVSELQDGADVLMVSDNFILNGGSAATV